MRFGGSDTAPLQRIDFQLDLETDVADMFAPWSPVKNILWVTFWVTFGAVLLMLAQAHNAPV